VSNYIWLWQELLREREHICLLRPGHPSPGRCVAWSFRWPAQDEPVDDALLCLPSPCFAPPCPEGRAGGSPSPILCPRCRGVVAPHRVQQGRISAVHHLARRAGSGSLGLATNAVGVRSPILHTHPRSLVLVLATLTQPIYCKFPTATSGLNPAMLIVPPVWRETCLYFVLLG
jgi:hypothetical protein